VTRILYRDARLVVLNKPANVSLLADRSGAPCLWDTLGEELGTKPYLVHRLDKGTSGALLVALDQATQSTLTRAFSQRQVRKFYLTWARGDVPAGRTLTIDLPLRKGRKSRYRVAGPRDHIVHAGGRWSLLNDPGDGKASVTRLRLLRPADGASLLLAMPITGRTHQLRVHLAWIGHPIQGDPLYGRPGPDEPGLRLQLHCHRLLVPGFGRFTAPVSDLLDSPAPGPGHSPRLKSPDGG
jgi:23S rRNA-/tRNA-specific pseudouridylate synthase